MVTRWLLSYWQWSWRNLICWRSFSLRLNLLFGLFLSIRHNLPLHLSTQLDLGLLLFNFILSHNPLLFCFLEHRFHSHLGLLLALNLLLPPLLLVLLDRAVDYVFEQLTLFLLVGFCFFFY